MLQSLQDVGKCFIDAADGAIRSVKDFCFDGRTWVLGCLVFSASRLDGRRETGMNTHYRRPTCGKTRSMRGREI